MPSQEDWAELHRMQEEADRELAEEMKRLKEESERKESK